jgi:RPA family protein
MAEIRKREIAYKLRIGEILKGKPQLTPMGDGKDRFNFLELGDKKIVRVNLIANVIDKFISEGEKKFATLTLDDATGQINVKAFGDEVAKFQDKNQGQTLAVIGVLRIYNNELYILPDIMKEVDPRYLLIRKLEIEKAAPKQPVSSEERIALKDQIISKIKQAEVSEGIDTEKLIMEISANPAAISQEVRKLQEDGVIYEPRPGRVRYLG